MSSGRSAGRKSLRGKFLEDEDTHLLDHPTNMFFSHRQRSAFIPFSYGPRSCVGRNVAEVCPNFGPNQHQSFQN
jgi:hypothetical protein